MPKKNYSLTRNEKNRHCLHGGIHSVSFINWTLVSIREEDTSAEVLFHCPGCAAAFEFQDYPDAPGNHGFPFHYTEAGKEWTRYLRYTFVI